MENKTTSLYDLDCIIVTRLIPGEKSITDLISWNDFQASFVQERWKNERRYGTTTTLFGMAHTKMTVKFDDGIKSTRTFDFPKSVAEAEERHANRLVQAGD